MENQIPNNKFNNPIVKFIAYMVLTMALGIGAAWLLLGIFSPVLLILLIMKW